VLSRYGSFERLIVVTHAVVIQSVIGTHRSIDHAEIVPYDLEAEPVERLAAVGKR
jgi:hypothetical protein